MVSHPAGPTMFQPCGGGHKVVGARGVFRMDWNGNRVFRSIFFQKSKNKKPFQFQHDKFQN